MAEEQVSGEQVPQPADLEIKDAQLIFHAVWSDLVAEYSEHTLHFPREIIWLGGAPGAGKGTNTPFVAEMRDITAEPVVVSALLNSPQARQMKDSGQMVGDREVISLLLRHLLDPAYHDGVIVDGFPRTKVQVECLKLFYQRMLHLHRRFHGTEHAREFRNPLFRIVLLFVSEEVSVQRQLHRGQEIREHNRLVREAGVGELMEERPTDLDPELCRNRYRVFKETTFEALQSLRKIFHFHFIDAEDDIETVQHNIEREFAYQSSLELEQETFAMIRHLPLAEELGVHARQELIERLEKYREEQPELLRRVVRTIEEKFVPIVRRHAMSGKARISSEEDLFDEPEALRMLIDVFAERGFHALVDIRKEQVPERFDPRTGQIHTRTKRIYRFHLEFPANDIRRGLS